MKRAIIATALLALSVRALGLETAIQQAVPAVPHANAAGEEKAPRNLARTKMQTMKTLLRQAIERQSLTFVPAPDSSSGTLFLAQGPGLSLSLERQGLTVRERHPLPPALGPKDEIKSAASGNGSTTPKQVEFESSTAHLEFVGANPQAEIEGLNPVAAYTNYFVGNDAAKWRTHVTQYSQVRYKDLYPGIDLVYYGRKGSQLEYDLVVSPGADPGLIRLRVVDDHEIHLDEAGNLPLDGKDGNINLGRPVLYQDIDHGKRAIAGQFVQVTRNEFAFKTEKYDHTYPLIIDPTINLLYATYAGGIHDDQALDMTLDTAGNVYLTGESASQDFPVSGNAYQAVRKNIGSYVYNAVVMKFDPSGNLLFSTFLGGSTGDQGEGVRVDSNGLVYVGGGTSSGDFPVTSNAYQGTYGGGGDAFFSVLSNDGSQLIYSTFLGGSGNENIFRMQSDPSAGFWLAGNASGAGLPATSGAYQSAPSGGAGFIAHVEFIAANTDPLKIDALTFLGGSTSSAGSSIYDLSLDPTGNVYVTGITTSTDYPVTANAYQNPSTFTLSGGCYNSSHPNSIATVSELTPDLKTLVYSSVLGGKTEDQNGYPVCNQFGHTIHADGKGNIWVVGITGMQDFPTTANALSSQLNGNGSAGVDLTVTELTLGTTSTALTYSTYLGGSQFDYGPRAVWDSANDIWIVATSQSTNWPGIVQGKSLQPANAGGYDITLTELQPDGTKILYATYLGGSGDEDASLGRSTLAMDANSNLYLAGGTGSTNYPVTGNAAQYTFANGDSGPDGYDFYYTILGNGAIGTVGPATSGNSGDATITVTGAGFQSGASCSLVLNGTTITAVAAAVANNGTSIACTFALNGAAPGAYNVIVANPNGGGSFTQTAGFTVTSGGQPNLWVNVVARPKIRAGVPSVVTVNYGNSGSEDAYFSTLRITLPPNVSASYNIGVTNNLPVGVQTGTAATTSTGKQIPMFLPHLAAGSSGSFDLTITDTVNADTYTIGAEIGQPWYTSAQAATAELTSQSQNFVPATSCTASAAGQQTVGSCLGVYLAGLSSNGYTTAQVQAQAAGLLLMLQQAQTGFTPLISSGTSYVPAGQLETGTLVVSGIPSFDNYVLFHVMQTSQRYLIPISSSICVTDDDNIGDAIGGTLLKCTFNNVTAPQLPGVVIAGESLGLGAGSSITPEPDACFTVMQNIAPTTFTITTRASEICGTGQSQDYPYKPDGDPLPFADPWDPSDGSANGGGFTGGSIDPNDKTGSTGDLSTNHFVRPTIPLPYSVYFENEATATLPAAKVVVTDQLDPTKYDLKSLTLGSMYFGGNVVTVPFNVSSYNTVYRINSSLEVRVQGSLDTTTGLLKWTFTSLDPSTGLPPTDPTVGFLPPDTDGIVGQGSVLFNVMPLASQSTSTQITNTASVVFDSNAPISTPTWLNTIDGTAPVSSMTALPATEITTGSTATFTVNWSGMDVGSGIANYNIYVSDNGGAFTLWQRAVIATSASYTGALGHTYGFYSIATDKAGNVEAAKTGANTVTTVTPPAPLVSTTALTASNTSIASGGSVTFTAVVKPPSGTTTVPTGTVTFLNGTSALGTGTLNGSGTATFTTTSLAVGTNSVTAQYGGDADFAVSTSAAVSVVVGTPNFSLSLSPTSVSIASGSSGTTAVTATPAFGFSSTVAFACSGLPAHATCTFSPSTITPSGGAASTTTLTIATNVTSALLRKDLPRSLPNERTPLLCVVFLGAIGLVRVRRQHRTLLRGLLSPGMLAILLLALAGGTLIGCGGSSAKTPGGTSTVTITATGGGQTQTATLSVTVQ